MPKISNLTALSAQPDDADELAIVDDSAGTTKRVTYANLMAGATGLIQRGQTTIAGAAVTTATVSGLDGDTHGLYLIHFLWLQAATIGSLSLEPNGLATNLRHQNHRVVNGSTGSGTNTNLLLLGGLGSVAAGDWHEGWALLRAASGQERHYFSWAYTQSSGAGANSQFMQCAGVWADTGTNITSLDFVAQTTSAIDVGSIFTVYQVTHDAL